ncbi:hypothetical protein TPA0910_09640 [Streptomyces hygroscopicus subsp. sporocinereus]|uniref:Uncharacterized protein n=1 Tax=Streptomyces hygroscopicus TaxID=1912 RepID=A0ABQ3TT72_STRHY|nr:hypothetical protein TPA0910_09640 [Streptomyces hygroscopicus]
MEPVAFPTMGPPATGNQWPLTQGLRAPVSARRPIAGPGPARPGVGSGPAARPGGAERVRTGYRGVATR